MTHGADPKILLQLLNQLESLLNGVLEPYRLRRQSDSPQASIPRVQLKWDPLAGVGSSNSWLGSLVEGVTRDGAAERTLSGTASVWIDEV